MTEQQYLFVYGSMLQGQPSEGFLSELRRWPGTTMGQLWRTPAGTAALVPTPDGRPIKGEVVKLDSEHRLPVLDLFHGVQHGRLRRERIDVESMSRPGKAWAWVLDETTAKRRGYAALTTTDWSLVAPRMLKTY